MEDTSFPFVALGSRLRGVKEVLTLGVKPNFLDYTPEERRLILNAKIVLFPTTNYAQFLTTLGKRIFPSLETHLYADEKIKQTTLFYMLGIPHPRTKVYFRRHHREILKDFSFPFIAKIPRGSSQGRGVFKIENKDDLERYLSLTHVAYIQEYIPHDRDLRVVLINYDPIIAYWRIKKEGEFRTNLSQGGRISFKNVPDKAIELAIKWAKMCRFNDVGIDMIEADGGWKIIEANMKYGKKGLLMKGLNIKEIFRRKLLSGEIS